MSLATDKFFYRAIAHNATALTLTEARIFNTADESVDDAEDTRVPYVIITNNGGRNDTGSKDDQGESDTDIDNISVEIAATSREQLHEIAEAIRAAIKQAFSDFGDEYSDLGFWLNDYTFSYGPVNYDAFKPCYWQTLNYECETSA